MTNDLHTPDQHRGTDQERGADPTDAELRAAAELAAGRADHLSVRERLDEVTDETAKQASIGSERDVDSQEDPQPHIHNVILNRANGPAGVEEFRGTEEWLAAAYRSAGDADDRDAVIAAWNNSMVDEFGYQWADRDDLPEADLRHGRWLDLTDRVDAARREARDHDHDLGDQPPVRDARGADDDDVVAWARTAVEVVTAHRQQTQHRDSEQARADELRQWHSRDHAESQHTTGRHAGTEIDGPAAGGAAR